MKMNEVDVIYQTMHCLSFWENQASPCVFTMPMDFEEFLANLDRYTEE